jgi:N-acetylglucosaminyldiphosphoundecaprenol N-acetyl-beta-D-mannosaminyltransferase
MVPGTPARGGAPGIPSLARENVLGVGISAINMQTALATLEGWIARRERHYVCVTGVHGVMESQADDELRAIHNRAGMVTPDGMPMAWLLKWGGHRGTDRVCGPEMMPLVFERFQALGTRHYLYGATPETLEKLQAQLLKIAPKALIVGTFSPPFRALDEAEQQAIATRINGSGADIVWVGLSTPKQEFWMSRFRPLLEAPALIGVGAAFDIHAGVVARAPKFLRRTGFEWSYRLVKQPGRLWRRYLSSNPRFVALILMQKLGRRYSLSTTR